MREMVGGCCVCSDDRGWSENPLVYCDGQSCTVAVHQACYGIVTVPTGPWYCRKCESQERSVKVKCELCPSKYGALKRTDNSGWAHVVCALYIPEVRFGNVTTMEPIQLQLIPAERFNKVCYICEEKGKASSAAVGACMQCNKAGCKQQFHVTCAQGLGLLCEEAGNYLDNVKYCGYCQHHYSKLKKGGNVKTIPPYKPVAGESHLSDSNSEKDADPAGAGASTTIPTTKSSTSTTAPPVAAGKRKSSSSNTSKSTTPKTSTTSSTKASSTSSSSQQPKAVHNNSSSSGSKSGEKTKPLVNSGGTTTSKSGKSDNLISDSASRKETSGGKGEVTAENVEPVKGNDKDNSSSSTGKGGSGSKKRKSHSRTPTPISVVASESVSVVVSAASLQASSAASEKKNTTTVSDVIEKPKKIKIDTTQSIIINQPVVALTSISTIKATSPATTVADTATTNTAHSALPTQPSIIQTAQTQPVNSLVVSVPLSSTSLSPHHHHHHHHHHTSAIVSNQASVLTANTSIKERSASADRSTSANLIAGTIMTGGHSNPGTMLSSDMSGGLKITYEKQVALNNTEVDMDLEVSPSAMEDIPAKRGRSQSNDKTDRGSRGKKRGGGATNTNGIRLSISFGGNASGKRSNRTHQATPPPPQLQQQVGAFSSITQSQIKDSPPSSPSSESQGAPPSSRSRTKSRKSAPASVNISSSSKDSKDIKLFQNGVAAPHMLGNSLNPTSNMAQKMTDHLNSELEAHSIFNPNENSSNLVGPQLHHRVVASARASSTGGSSTASGGSGLSSMLSGAGGNIPQTLDQLLERQWEQGSQFLMEQAQHFDIASLLSCLHQLRAENLRLEEHVSSLLQRRDHLLAVNARLAIPLTGQPATPQSSHAHTVNNIHPAVAAVHGDMPRSSRNPGYPHPQGPVENGLPPEQPYSQHRGQPSPNVRHSPAAPGGYPNSGLLRQNADTSGRSAPRPQPYPLYQGPGPSSQQQVVISRRDTDMHHQNSSKPS